MIANNLKIYIRKKLEEMFYGFNILQGYFTSSFLDVYAAVTLIQLNIKNYSIFQNIHLI